MSVLPICLECFGPYSFFNDNDLPCALTCQRAASKGVYLWTLPFGDTYRVNYVGKTSNRGGFAQRFRQELRFAEFGKRNGQTEIREPLVDCERWFRGERIVAIARPSASDSAAAWSDVKRMYQALHVFLVPVTGDDNLRARLESTITRQLWESCEACRRFMCSPHVRRPPMEPPWISLKLSFPPGVRICGLEVPIREMQASQHV